MSGIVLSGDTSGTVALNAPTVAGTQSYTLPTAVPAANGYALTSTTAGVMSWAAPSGGTPGGSNTQIQFNNSSAFGGSANFTWDGTNAQLGATGALRFADSDSSNYVAFKSPATVASNVTWTLPSTDGTSGQVLSTNGSGVLSWVNRAAETPTSVEYLVVAGGGSGASNTAGGGGAGGFRSSSSFSVTSATPYTVTVGAGGAGVAFSTAGNQGSSSVFSSITSIGGGKGGDFGVNGGSGGSGGGAGSGGAVGSGTSGQGNSGGLGSTDNVSYGTGGGGGGAGAAGSNASSASGGNGGSGSSSSITGTSTTYAGGGGGSGDSRGSRPGGTGGSGGGGNGGFGGSSTQGAANTGGGSGGNGFATGSSLNGGSGVVIIAYPDNFAPLTSIGVGLTYDQPTRSGYRVYRFTAGTGTIQW